MDDGWSAPPGGWPDWLWSVRYDGSRHPGSADISSVADGANCQLYAYAVLDRFDRHPNTRHRSSDLWMDPSLAHPGLDDFEPLDIALFNDTEIAWGAHVALRMTNRELLHLCASEGHPAVWTLEQFASVPRYRNLIGIVRVPPGDGRHGTVPGRRRR